MNCKGVRGDPGDEVVFMDCGLLPFGVDRAKEGIGVPLGSGVRGGVAMISDASMSVVELIHFSSLDAM